MNKPNTIAIVGCGGIACALLPHLALDYNLVLIDGDKFEPGNSTRQFPAIDPASADRNKAEFLCSTLRAQFPNREIQYLPMYVEGASIFNQPEMQGVDFIICAVDNNQSREILCDISDARDIPMIMCGNELECADAHLMLPGYHYPMEVYDFGAMTKAPFACTSDDNPAAEQTSRANFLAAACGVHILSSLLYTDERKNYIVKSSLDVRGQSERVRYRDLIAKQLAEGDKAALQPHPLTEHDPVEPPAVPEPSIAG